MAKQIFKVAIDNQPAQQVNMPVGGTVRGLAINRQNDRMYLLVEAAPDAALTEAWDIQVVTGGASTEALGVFLGIGTLRQDKVVVAVYGSAVP